VRALSALRWLPQPLARWIVRRGARAIALFNRAFHPRVRGAGVLVRHGGRMLLVRSTYQSWWGIPAGRIARGEDPRTAAARELLEEAGLRAELDALRLLGDLELEHSNIRDHVWLFELACASEPGVRCDGVEIAELRWAREEELDALRLWPPLRAWLQRDAEIREVSASRTFGDTEPR
jgi:8-oxo-dGTP pyrophosphatase MutT (NUDIX family)